MGTFLCVLRVEQVVHSAIGDRLKPGLAATLGQRPVVIPRHLQLVGQTDN